MEKEFKTRIKDVRKLRNLIVNKFKMGETVLCKHVTVIREQTFCKIIHTAYRGPRVYKTIIGLNDETYFVTFEQDYGTAAQGEFDTHEMLKQTTERLEMNEECENDDDGMPDGIKGLMEMLMGLSGKNVEVKVVKIDLSDNMNDILREADDVINPDRRNK